MATATTPLQVEFISGVYNYPFTPVCIALNKVYSGYNTTYATTLCNTQIITTCQYFNQILYRCNSYATNYTQNRELEVQDQLTSFFLYNQTTIDIITPVRSFDGVVYGVLVPVTVIYLLIILVISFADYLPFFKSNKT
jgi:hypothetical protein